MNRQSMVLNAELILLIESTPDTVVTMTNGDRVHVLESSDEVVARAIAYKRLLSAPVEKSTKAAA